MNDVTRDGLDLTVCDREPIHSPGAIQSFGFLIALTVDWLVAHASTNAGAQLGLPEDRVLGQSMNDLFQSEACHTIRNLATMLRGADSVERVFAIALRDGVGAFDVVVHFSGAMLVVEAEPANVAHTEVTALVRNTMSRLAAIGPIDAFKRDAARHIRAISGFDRVMVYRFDQYGHGEVVAESVRFGVESFMGLNYPASDIPAQARALYKRNIFRIIADVRAPIVPITRLPDTDAAPLDLSMSMLRSVSPVHLEYLQNMGVGASFSISIIVDGRLWGLFACHHLTPRLPGFVERTTLELVGTMFSLMLATRERSEVFTYETKARGVTDRLLSVLARDPARLRDAAWVGEVMADAIPADGVGVQIDGQIVLSGLTPNPSEFQDLLTDLNWASTTEVFTTDHIAAMTPAAVSYAERASGLLAIPLSRSPRDFIVLFRAQRRRTVRWAGHPLKPVETEATGTRLSPRKSFAAWSEQVNDRATPFTAAEIRVATAVRGTLLDIVLEMYGVAEDERKSMEDRQNLLISELNHRVRNILALIRGIMSQTKRFDNGQDMMSSLDARIQSLARAHDQLTSDKLGTARLRALIDTEILAFAADKRDRVRITGPDIRLLPRASTIAVLIVHELVTNSTKYGALSAEGAIAIDWTIVGNGGLSLTWRETDGPSVTPPRRRGFGSSIIERSLPHELGGTAELRFRVTGVEADFTIPAEYIRYDIDPASFEDPADPALPIPLRPLAGKSVLLVEDSLIIAMYCESSIQELGARDVFLAATVADALAVLATRDFDFAVLDVNLGRENSMPIGEVLADRAIPFIFATGYGETTIIPPRLRDRGIIVKPYTRADLAREVTRAPR